MILSVNLYLLMTTNDDVYTIKWVLTSKFDYSNLKPTSKNQHDEVMFTLI
jgi:hypothetical protein